MTDLLYQQLDELLTNSPGLETLKCEGALRVAAGTLSRGAESQISATSVVCEVSADDLDAFESLVSDIAAEYGLGASMRQCPGSYSVRFTCLAAAPAVVEPTARGKSVLMRLIGR